METGDYIGWTIYFLGWVFSTWRFAGQIAWEMASFGEAPEREDIATGWGCGAIFALFWPVALPVSLWVGRPKRDSLEAPKFLYTPPDKEKELLRARIKELERSTGIQ